jgi:hypothetical protein
VTIVDADAVEHAASFGREVEPTLLRMLHVMLPHHRVPDDPYLRSRSVLMSEAVVDRRLHGLLLQGACDLDALGGAPFVELNDADATTVLERIEPTVFFRRVREIVCRAFYDDAEVRGLLGYEGPAVQLGGYINRGFDDLDWLPEPPL